MYKFPKDLNNIICDYLDIDDFYELKKIYSFLDINKYLKTHNVPTGSESSYRRYECRFIIPEEDQNQFHNYSWYKHNDLDWACHCGYLEVFRSLRKKYRMTDMTIYLISTSGNSNFVEYMINNEKFDISFTELFRFGYYKLAYKYKYDNCLEILKIGLFIILLILVIFYII